MRCLSRSLLFVLLASSPSISSAQTQFPAGPQSALEFIDLSESGQALSLEFDRKSPGTLTVRTLPGMDWDEQEFEVRGAVPGEKFYLRLDEADPSWAPAVSMGNFGWETLTELRSGAPGARLFQVDPPRARFTVRLAAPAGGVTEAPYYTYTQYLDYIATLSDTKAQVTQVGTSIQGRPLLRIVIEDASFTGPKKTVLMVVRQHGNEFGSSYILEGALNYLLTPRSKEIQVPGGLPGPGGSPGLGNQTAVVEENLRRVRWVIYGLMNPDGAVANQRGNATGTDLNRDWESNGANAGQEPETFAIQTDIQDLEALWGFSVAGDHHGWGNAMDGGFRYANGLAPSSVSFPEYAEARKDTLVVALHDPTQAAWQENGGTVGMMRVELFQRFAFLIHTPEYNSFASTPDQFRDKGKAWVLAMVDTVYAPRITDPFGATLRRVRLGSNVFLEVDDRDENLEPAVAETVLVTVTDSSTGDTEIITLTETGTSTSVFRSSAALTLTTSPSAPGDGMLRTSSGSTITAIYGDDDYARDTSMTSALVK